MPLEQSILDLFRLGLKQDVASIRRYGKKLLQDEELGPEIRAGVAKLLAALPSTSTGLRWAQSDALPDDLSFVVALPPNPAEARPLLTLDVQQQVDQLVSERERFDELERIGLIPTRTVLLNGPPGVGKSLTARHLANRMQVPLLRVDLSGLMSSYLGKTGQNLRSMLVAARESPSVLLLDEFDAIAKRRDDPGDVGELKRIVNVLLLELEEWPATGLLIAATNHPELLDRAIWRRFEKVINIGLPTPEIRGALLERQIAQYNQNTTRETLRIVVDATEGSSASDVVTIVRGAVRQVVLQAPKLFHDALLEETLERLLSKASDDTAARSLYCRVASEHLAATQREIAARLGISHVAVGKILRSLAPSRAARGARSRTEENSR